VCIDDDVVLAAGLTAIHWRRAGGRPALHRPDVTGVDRSPGEIQQIGRTQFGKQQFVQPLPDTCLVPVAQAPPTRHPGTKAELLWQNSQRIPV
jgi:hypothetical protein